MKLWKGRFQKEADPKTNDFNSSISIDSRMYKEDIEGSIAHATMLGAAGIIDKGESEKICAELEKIEKDIETGALHIDPDAEDIHTFIEGELTARIGDAGKRLHTARSRNDQVALDVRLTLRKECAGLMEQLKELINVLCDQAEEYADTVMPGYTHLQRAQPITFGHHLMAYAEMFLRDIGRMQDALKRMDVCPLGSGALAGTTYPLDRDLTAKLLGFSGVSRNSLDGVADRDFCAEIAAAISLAMVHLSRFSEEIILWCSWEFKFIELDDAFSTGSSIMPQKKNPDITELIRGKSGRVFGDLMALLTMMKGLPLAYNKDMQEDKEGALDAAKTLAQCLAVMTGMVSTWTVNADRMRSVMHRGHLAATDVADYLAKHGMPFREAHAVVGHLVLEAEKQGCDISELPFETFKEASDLFGRDITKALDLDAIVAARTTEGGTAPVAVAEQLRCARARYLVDENAVKLLSPVIPMGVPAASAL